MLLAEVHGKVLEAGRRSEDYLTSATFGHLRYLPPKIFWADALGRARNVAGEQLADVLGTGAPGISDASHLNVHFWRRTTYGEPDLILAFRGGSSDLIVLIEVKLDAEKSGTGERDQLVRYLDLLDDNAALAELELPAASKRLVVYLTPREALVELRESARLAPGREARLFRLQWQDVLDAACHIRATTERDKTILNDVAKFLTALGLQHFTGFTRCGNLTEFQVERADVASSSPAWFQNFKDDGSLAAFEVEKGGWAR